MFINKYINIIITYFLPLREAGLIDNRIKDYIKKKILKEILLIIYVEIA